MRKYPVGIQSFETIRRDGYVYVDKTRLIYKMVTEGLPYFLSRPRRFGKSLLVSTLAALFEGRRELFEEITLPDGTCQPQLYIATTNWSWDKHPVLRFDFSKCNEYTIDGLKEQIDSTLRKYEQIYNLTEGAGSYSIRLEQIILQAHQQTGQRVAVLVDEYDTVMLHNLGTPAKEREVRECLLGTFGLLKAMDDHVCFVFFTGISKFSQMGIFSRLNNLTNISMVPAYDSLCGISEQELTTTLRPDIEALAAARGKDYDTQLTELKQLYDGYHFSEGMTDIYNPFSLVNAFNTQQTGSFWFDRGTSAALIDMLAQMPPVDMTELEGIRLPASTFDLPLESFDDPLPILYQSGYITIKGHDSIGLMDTFTLGFPNGEVRMGFAECLFKHVAGRQATASQTSRFLSAYNRFLSDDNLPQFLEALKTFFAGIPYPLADDGEHHYHALLYTLLVAFGADISAEEMSAQGRADLVLKMPRGIYVFELKHDRTTAEALQQIRQKNYAEKYQLDGRSITLVGLSFSSQQRNISEWKTEQLDI